MTKTPPDPTPETPEIDTLANKVEEKRLMRMDVLEPLKLEDAHLDRFTTRCEALQLHSSRWKDKEALVEGGAPSCKGIRQ